MMTLAKIDQFGAPDYGVLKPVEGVVFHTPENTDPSIEAAVSTARWQATAGNSSGGSYHGILGYDNDLGPMSDPNAWVLVKTVPFGHIAGSISTNRDPAVWQPDRYPWINRLLSDAAYADPNAYLHALCLGGKAAWWSNKLSSAAGRAEVRGAIVALARWVRHLERRFDYDALLTLHRHWQTNRSDPDGLNFTDLVLDEYERLFLVQPAEPPKTYIQAELDAAIAAALAPKDATIRTLRGRLAAKDKNVGAAQRALVAAREA